MEKTIGLFKAALSGKSIGFQKVNAVALPLGYIVHPDCCTEAVLEWLQDQHLNPNATFYKSWNDVTSKSRLELLFDQVLHYASTYGAAFMGESYVPNANPEFLPFNTYTLIEPVEPEALAQRCLDMTMSGVALSQETLGIIMPVIISAARNKTLSVNPDKVKNKEALVRIASELGLTPSDPVLLLRLMVYSTAGSSMLIQNKETIRSIKMSKTKFDMSTLSEKQLKGLSSIFRRFKNVILPFKGYKDNTAIINRLGRDAKFNHKPMAPDFWGTLLVKKPSILDVCARLGELNAFRTVSLLMALENRLMDHEYGSYLVRNQKLFVKKNSPTGHSAAKALYWYRLYKALTMYLAEKLKGKAVPVLYPEHINLTCPSSEKSFVGPFPAGSNVVMNNGTIAGIYWRNEWGTRDFDLSFVDPSGKKIGWNAAYYDKDSDKAPQVVYSGDMTNADPEAAENILFTDNNVEGIVQVNRYCGDQGSKFRFYIADEEIKNGEFNKNYMVNPDSIRVMGDMISEESKQSILGIMKNGTFTFMNTGIGSSRVSSAANSLDAFKALAEKTRYYISLKTVLEMAGFPEATEEDVKNGNCLDLRNLSKDTLINLFSEKS